MKEIVIHGKISDSRILIGESLENVGNYIAEKNVIIITDKNVNYFYSSIFTHAKVIVLDAGENSKSLETVEVIYNKFLEFEVDRSWFVLGIGGGVICDIAGFVASTYMRGLKFGFVSTTLLAQVDASIGGKNAVNFNNLKNLIGTINQPDFVVCDIDLLKTLPKRELKCGFAEIIKHALVSDMGMLKFIEDNVINALLVDSKLIEELLYRSLQIKSEIVMMDERDRGERRKLNFGHTFGHAIESIGKLNHGEAISIGMHIAAKISYKKKYLKKHELDRIVNVLENYDLPVQNIHDNENIIEKIRSDKKRNGDNIDFILLKKIGCASIQKMSFEEIEKMTSPS